MPNENLEPLQPDRAYSLASRLTLIPGFPNRDQAIQAVAEWLLENCTVRIVSSGGDQIVPSLHRAEWLISNAIQDPQWQGIDGLQVRYDQKFRPRLPIWNGKAEKVPDPECGECNDMGVTGQPYRWCDCRVGQSLRAELPRYLELCQGQDKRGAISRGTSEAEAELHRIMEIQRENQERAKGHKLLWFLRSIGAAPEKEQPDAKGAAS